ncbi:dihydrofolate reductase family protein [Demequina sp.]|uniref:dihydrofolate reductase family protein n=1 Tax=Demequina sp. TaxID=2050685 RepID=UPI003D09A2F9
MEPGSLVAPDGSVLTPERAETALRALYAVPTPWVRVSMIQSVDGRAAGADGSSRSLNGEEDLRILRVARSWADVVLVGAETARAEEYGDVRLRPEFVRARAGVFRRPLPDLAIVTRSGDVPEDLDPERTWLVTCEDAPAAELAEEWGDRVIVAGDRDVDPSLMLSGLARRGLTRVLCEGGPQLASLLLDADAVDDYCLTTSPARGGADAPAVPPVPAGWALAHTLAGNDFRMERWTR